VVLFDECILYSVLSLIIPYKIPSLRASSCDSYRFSHELCAINSSISIF
jgi:hypothetical protein